MYSSTLEAPVLLVGAAHVVDVRSPLRKALAKRVLDGVAIELDEERAAAILREPDGTGTSARNVPLMLRLWGVVQRRLGQELGQGAGAEMRAAAEIARERRLPLFLIDDPIRSTMGRMLHSLSFKERVSLFAGSFVGLLLPSRVVENQIDKYNAARGEYLEEIRLAFPTVVRVLLDERNEHMADRLVELRRRGFGRVAAVVGDAHVPGLAGALRRRGLLVETIDFAALRPTTVP
ncbi:MAG: TraB domain-containing protein [Thermoplasmata archaeon]|nr:TraB domain-containing protein [Thermoplasmata archaeon]